MKKIFLGIFLLTLLVACATRTFEGELEKASYENVLKQANIETSDSVPYSILAKDLKRVLNRVFPGKELSDLNPEPLLKNVKFYEGNKVASLLCEDRCNLQVTNVQIADSGFVIPESCQSLNELSRKEIPYSGAGRMYFSIKPKWIEIDSTPELSGSVNVAFEFEKGKMIKTVRPPHSTITIIYWYSPINDKLEYAAVLNEYVSTINEWIDKTKDYNPDWKIKIIQIRDCMQDTIIQIQM